MNPNVTGSSLQQSLYLATSQVITSLLAFVPQLLASILVILVGILLSRFAKSLVITFLHALNLSALTQNSAVEKFLKRADIRLKIEEIFGEIVRWLILYIFIIAAVNTVGLITVGNFLENILSYLPNIVAAIFILAIGVILAGFTESFVKSSIATFDPSTGRLAGKISSYAVVIFAVLFAIGELGIAESFINTLFTGFVAMLALGFGLAFGLGAKDLVSRILNKWYQDFQKPQK